MGTTNTLPDQARPPRLARACLAVLGLIVLMACQTGASAPVATATSTRLSAVSSHDDPTIRLKRLGTSYTQVYTDGVRWAVYEPTEDVTRIMDTVNGTSTTRPDPEGCAGGLIAVGGGEILYACSDPECPEATDACVITPFHTPGEQPYKFPYELGRWVVEDAASGTEHQLNIGKGLPPYRTRYETSTNDLSLIGSQWAASVPSQAYFVNWHTGQVLEEEEEPSSANRDYENLDSEALFAPLCPPLELSPYPTGVIYENPPRYSPFAYSPPFMIEDRYSDRDFRFHSYLRRCGSTRVTRLPEEAGLRSGLLFSDDGRVTQLNPDGRSWLGRSYRIGGLSKDRSASQGVTSTMVFEAFATRETTSEPKAFREGAPTERGPDLYDVRVGRLPWVKPSR
jgi:hypothetical protein